MKTLLKLKDVIAHAKVEIVHSQHKEKNVPISVKSETHVPDGKTSQTSKKLAFGVHNTTYTGATSIISEDEDGTCEQEQLANVPKRVQCTLVKITATRESDDKLTLGLSPPTHKSLEYLRVLEKGRLRWWMSCLIANLRYSILWMIREVILEPAKKIKLEVAGDSDDKVSLVSQGPHKIKPCSKYSNSDLPVPVDPRWTNSFLDTAMLWAGSQPNIWSIPEDMMNHGSQAVFAILIDYSICQEPLLQSMCTQLCAFYAKHGVLCFAGLASVICQPHLCHTVVGRADEFHIQFGQGKDRLPLYVDLIFLVTQVGSTPSAMYKQYSDECCKEERWGPWEKVKGLLVRRGGGEFVPGGWSCLVEGQRV
ncbi:hypothetical protein EDC04DRAFT_2613374 [Pisolithus marmoratus]|nr:hypothetical protein EDC04DRAFT_2613374 [Pisolithus marmoratus]